MTSISINSQKLGQVNQGFKYKVIKEKSVFVSILNTTLFFDRRIFSYVCKHFACLDQKINKTAQNKHKIKKNVKVRGEVRNGPKMSNE